MSIADLRAAVEALDLADQTPFLVFGWNEAKGAIGGGEYPIHEDMAVELLAIAKSALEDVQSIEMSTYAGATLLQRGEQGLWVSRDQMRDVAPILDLLLRPDALNRLRAADIEGRSLAFSAIGFGARPDDRTFFIRRRAMQYYGTARIYAVLAGDLRPVDSPIISIDRAVDFILRPEGAVVFETSAFEKYIQEPADAVAEFDKHVNDLTALLPFDEATIAHLKQLGSKMTYRGRLRSLREASHYASLSVTKVRAELRRLKLRSNEFVKGNMLSFPASSAPFFLRLLDDAAWRGGFSGELYTTDGKRKES